MADLHVDVRKFIDGLEGLAARITQATGMALREGVVAAEASAKSTSLFQDQTGGTRGSIRGEVVGPTLGFVRAGGAAAMLQNGTRAHPIVARGTALRFVINGQVFFRTSVQHPGTRARPFMTEARDAGERALAAAIPIFVGEAIRHAK